MKKIRCAIYTRKSSEDGLEQEFNSLDAQREACAAFITSQKIEGWVLVPDAYDDGGLSGGSLERPALQRLMADIRSGKERGMGRGGRKQISLLIGKLFDETDDLLTPSHTKSSKGHRLRYYVSNRLIRS